MAAETFGDQGRSAATRRDSQVFDSGLGNRAEGSPLPPRTKPHKAPPPPPGRLRIIGGRWRGRKLEVAPVPGLRPTPDRVRETVFNWLRPYLPGARCLDLFAGSGALGLEALSQGAGTVVMVDSHPEVVTALRRSAEMLGAAGVQVVHADVLRFLDGPGAPYDIVFLDPPYGEGLLAPCCAKLQAGGWLAPGAQVYLEAERGLGTPQVPAGWEVVRSKRAGQVGYHLAAARHGN